MPADQQNDGAFSAVLSEGDFTRLADHLKAEYGIHLPPSKRTMLEARLRKRMYSLGLSSFTEYSDFLFSARGAIEERSHMVDVVTTHKTDFFREPAHFEYLVQHALPDLVRLHGAGLQAPLIVWSAACSTGEEPYTLAMVLAEFADRYPGFRFRYSVIATDVSNDVLRKAERAIYDEDRVDPVPMALRRKYLLRTRDPDLRLVRIGPELRALVRFRCLNLMSESFGFREPLDAAFCRNVLIYFDRQTQARVAARIAACLRPGGYLFVGHSETLDARAAGLTQVAPTVYKRTT